MARQGGGGGKDRKKTYLPTYLPTGKAKMKTNNAGLGGLDESFFLRGWMDFFYVFFLGGKVNK